MTLEPLCTSSICVCLPVITRTRVPFVVIQNVSVARKTARAAHYRDPLHWQTDGRFLGPVGNEIPTHKAKDALGLRSVLADGRNLLRRRDVPTWCPGRIFVETKVVSDVALLRCQAVRPHMERQFIRGTKPSR